MEVAGKKMSDDFKALVAHGKDVYGDLVSRSWEILVAQTDATNPATIEATCDLQRNLVVVGAEWIRLCEQVLALADTAHALQTPARVAAVGAPTDAASIAEAMPIRAERRPRSRSRTEDIADALPTAQRPNANASGRKPMMSSSNGHAAYRIFPLILDSAPSHVQLVAMSFDGADWHPIAAWRRIYQQVIQSLQRSDPDRFDSLASTLTMSNGKPLFSKDRSVYMAPIDAGGGWFATGQMPTELILQRLRMLVDWWGLPRESLSVEVMPEAPAPTASRPNDAAPLASSDTSATSEPAPEPSTEARTEDGTTLNEDAPAVSLAHIEPPVIDEAEEGTPPFGEAVLDESPVLDEAPPEELAAGEIMQEGTPEAYVEAVVEPEVVDEVAQAQQTEARTEAVADAAIPEELAEAPVSDDAEGMEATAEAVPVAERPDEALLDEQSAAADTPDDGAMTEDVNELSPPTSTPDEMPGETVDAEVPSIPATTHPTPEPISDPVNGTEARIVDPEPKAAPVAVVVAPPALAIAEPLPETVVDEFVPPPMARASNIRWVKTINGTRLPLRPAPED